MAKIVNVVASCSNTGKTVLIEGLIKELKNRGYTVATIKHDVHGFDIDKEGKDTWRHRKAGAEAVIISSKERMALIREVQEEIPLEELIKQVEDFDFIIIEGYKKSKCNSQKAECRRHNQENQKACRRGTKGRGRNGNAA